VFSQDGTAVYVNVGYYPSLRLLKINLDSLKQSTIATSKYATEISLAADDSSIAFIEFGQAYLTPASEGPQQCSL